MSVRVETNNPANPLFKIEGQQEKELSRAKAIQICKEKYPNEFNRKKIFTLAIAIGALALLIIPAIATGLAALSICSFGIGLLITAPIILIAISILVKKIDDRTLYWSGNLARILIKQKEEEAKKEQKVRIENNK